MMVVELLVKMIVLDMFVILVGFVWMIIFLVLVIF